MQNKKNKSQKHQTHFKALFSKDFCLTNKIYYRIEIIAKIILKIRNKAFYGYKINTINFNNDN